MTENLNGLIQICKRLKEKELFKKYIDFIQFPFYRNLEIDTRISFDFPLTVFIGQNGCGKSSCLHALYGAPDRYTPYRFWFDTKVDPVNYYDDKRKRHSFWYSYKKGKVIKEVIKARIKRNNDPNYWETSRPLAWAGMKTRKDRNDRDKPIRKNVVYLDFRSELSAFDKFFYFGSVKNRRSRNKQEFLRTKSSSLNKLFKGEKKAIYSSTRSLNEPPKPISEKELEWISFILGRKYKSGISVLHSLFQNEGYSILFETEYANYSEAVAGSGEMAIVRLVNEVLNAPQESLILLDEPEVSLHPGAQERLKFFLLEQIKLQKHQVVLTTHSPSLVSNLPKEAIKVFYQKPSNGRFLVKENLYPEEAFYHIEYDQNDKKSITVEDKLAKQIIEGVLSEMGDAAKNLLNVKYNPGGETVIKKEFIKVFCLEEKNRNFVIFDGDQRTSGNHVDWRDFSANKINAKFLQKKIKEQNAIDINFSIDSNAPDSQKIELLKKYLDFYLSNVFYLPKDIPEEIIWNDNLAKEIIKVFISSYKEQIKLKNDLALIGFKKKYLLLAQIQLGNNNSDNVKAVHQMFLHKWIETRNQDFNSIEDVIRTILESS